MMQDSRGFLFGPMMAQHLDCAFAPIRKAGKLPGKLRTVTYKKEYGAVRWSVPALVLMFSAPFVWSLSV